MPSPKDNLDNPNEVQGFSRQNTRYNHEMYDEMPAVSDEEFIVESDVSSNRSSSDEESAKSTVSETENTESEVEESSQSPTCSKTRKHLQRLESSSSENEPEMPKKRKRIRMNETSSDDDVIRKPSDVGHSSSSKSSSASKDASSNKKMRNVNQCEAPNPDERVEKDDESSNSVASSEESDEEKGKNQSRSEKLKQSKPSTKSLKKLLEERERRREVRRKLFEKSGEGNGCDNEIGNVEDDDGKDEYIEEEESSGSDSCYVTEQPASYGRTPLYIVMLAKWDSTCVKCKRRIRAGLDQITRHTRGRNRWVHVDCNAMLRAVPPVTPSEDEEEENNSGRQQPQTGNSQDTLTTESSSDISADSDDAISGTHNHCMPTTEMPSPANLGTDQSAVATSEKPVETNGTTEKRKGSKIGMVATYSSVCQHCSHNVVGGRDRVIACDVHAACVFHKWVHVDCEIAARDA